MDAKELGNQPAHPLNGFTVDASGAFCGEIVRAPGLTKRELFAAMAMQGIWSNSDEVMTQAWSIQDIALNAVETADALLAELAKEQP